MKKQKSQSAAMSSGHCADNNTAYSSSPVSTFFTYLIEVDYIII